LIWRIGDGSEVKIWGDKWLPSTTTFMIQSPPIVLDVDAKVKELIDQEGQGWNLELLTEIFNQTDRLAIQSIPIICTKQPDELVWRGTKNGVFTVRSAYHMVKEQDGAHQPESSTSMGNNTLWSGIWSMQAPNTIKHFMWRACKNILPTKDNLLRRRVVEDPKCPICSLEVETIYHTIWDCPASKDVWGASQRVFQKSSFIVPDFFHVAELLYVKCGEDDFRLFAEIARKIWMRRNAYIYEGTFTHPNGIVRDAERAVNEYEQVNKRRANNLQKV
jgi:hypothetical protein